MKSTWNDNTCCLSYTANSMPVDALATSGARASLGMVLKLKVKTFHLKHQKNLSVQATEHALQLMPTSQLLMPCILDSPDHQQPWYKLCNTQLLVFIWGEFYWTTHTASMWRNDIDGLTHWGRDKMYAISQTTFWSAFSWMKMYKLPLRFHWSLFLCVQLTIFQHWFRCWLGTDQATSHYLNQWWLIYWCIYASLGLNELIQKRHNSSALAMELSLLHKGISRISKCMHIFVVAFFFFFFFKCNSAHKGLKCIYIYMDIPLPNGLGK